MENDKVILVTEHDDMVGIMDKMEAHKQGLLHRAFSVFIFNTKGEMLLQQRAISKYHSGGLWTNACCSHPMPGEKTKDAAQRRLMEELGFETLVEKIFDFVYKASFDNGLTEHEFDHVFVGKHDGKFQFDKTEVDGWAWIDCDALSGDVKANPHHYTPWFKIAMKRGVLAYCR